MTRLSVNHAAKGSSGRRRKKDARPSEILEAAMAEFAHTGFAGARLTSVAQRAGISHGTIYNYFDSKEALFRTLFRERLVDSLDPKPLGKTLTELTTPDVLRSALKIAFRQLAGSDAVALIRILLVENERFPDLVRDCRNEIFGKAESMLKFLVHQGIVKGELVEGRYQKHVLILLAPVITSVLFGPLSGSLHWIEEAEIEVDTFVDVVLHGVVKRP
jgi:AcrR family transcriptional regulator